MAELFRLGPHVFRVSELDDISRPLNAAGFMRESMHP